MWCCLKFKECFLILMSDFVKTLSCPNGTTHNYLWQERQDKVDPLGEIHVLRGKKEIKKNKT